MTRAPHGPGDRTHVRAVLPCRYRPSPHFTHSGSDERNRPQTKDSRMKHLLTLASLLAATQVHAQMLRYRLGDPFVFCTQGQDRTIAPAPCWLPMPPYTGAYAMMPYCDPPNAYGKSWSAADTDSLKQYLVICPLALTSGPWSGAGSPDMVPFKH